MKCENDLCEARSSHGDCCSMVWMKDKKGCPYFQLYEARAALMEWAEKQIKQQMAKEKRVAESWNLEYDNALDFQNGWYIRVCWRKMVNAMARYANLEFMLERAKEAGKE